MLDRPRPQPSCDIYGTGTTLVMNSETDPLAEFRHCVNRRARQFSAQWEASKRLIEKTAFPSTITQLLRLSQEGNAPEAIKETLRRVLRQRATPRLQDFDSESLKALTGLPPAKALRALCVYFELIPRPGAHWPVPSLSSEEVERRIRASANPFELLRDDGAASVLDLGAGDLSFAAELAEQYSPELQRQNRRMILHCLDRLDPRSTLGAPLRPDPDRIRTLKKQLGPAFSYFSPQDMFSLRSLDEAGQLAPRYSLAVCWAPATPTFAYEPGRLPHSMIEADLHRTKGTFRRIRYQGESALEVRHGDRALLFPSWKFEIVGPVALLNLLRQRGSLCVLGAVDAQVFWELLAQLLDEPRYRPPGRLFTAASLPEIFGEIYRALDHLPIGDSINLAELGSLRRQFPPAGESASVSHVPAAFRYIRISRGATFPGTPASSTARKFHLMVEEVPPWFLTLVPA
jgi:hypothetical protein